MNLHDELNDELNQIIIMLWKAQNLFVDIFLQQNCNKRKKFEKNKGKHNTKNDFQGPFNSFMVKITNLATLMNMTRRVSVGL